MVVLFLCSRMSYHYTPRRGWCLPAPTASTIKLAHLTVLSLNDLLLNTALYLKPLLGQKHLEAAKFGLTSVAGDSALIFACPILNFRILCLKSSVIQTVGLKL